MKLTKVLAIVTVLLIFFSVFTAHSFAAAKEYLYVSNGNTNTVLVIDPLLNIIVKTIPVGNQPREVVTYGNKVYVSNFISQSISVIDIYSNSVIATIPVVDIYPERISLSNDGKRLYTGDPWLTKVAVIDTQTNNVVKTLTGFNGPHTSIESISADRLYVVNQNLPNPSGYVSIIDTSNYSTISSIPVGYEAMTMILTPNGKKAYVGNNGGANKGNTVSVIDTTFKRVIKTITVGINPYDMIVNSNGTRVYVLNTFYWANQSGGTISIIDTETDNLIGTINLNDTPNSLTISKDDSEIYVTKNNTNKIDIISTTSNTIIKTLDAGNTPWGIAKVSSVDTTGINVPLLKQTSEPWQSLTYDNATKWSPTNPTINRWGCALTSATMVLQYYGLNKMPDSNPLDPGSVNAWLNSQPDGYIANGLINWLAVSRLSKLAKNSGLNPGFAFDALEYKRYASYDPERLKNNIENKQPSILEEPGHFIVAKGIENDTFAINDPFYNRVSLKDGYNNSFSSLSHYTPSNTDLSYVMLVTPTNIDVSLTKLNGDPVGEKFIQQPINDPLTFLPANESVKITYLPKPSDNTYKMLIKSPNNTLYSFKSYLYDINGNVKVSELSGLSDSSSEEGMIIFDPDDITNSNSQKIVTFESIRNDLNTANQLELIENGAFKSLSALINTAEKSYEQGKIITSKEKLKNFQQLLDVFIKKQVSEGIYKILLDDSSQLIQSF